MHAAYEATLTVARDSYGMLRAAVEDLPPGALDWKPAASANSLAVLTMHSISATRFWVRVGAGDMVSLAAYRADERGPAFEAGGLGAEELTAEIDRAVEELEEILGRGDASTLETMREWPEDPGMNKTGMTCLVHALGHLREHVGQAQLTRDLWFAQGKQ